MRFLLLACFVTATTTSNAFAGPWSVPPIAMAAHGDHIFIIENKKLYRVNPENGSYDRVGNTSWQVDPIAMTSHGDSLYVVENRRLYRVKPSDGTFVQVGDAEWSAEPIAMTSLNDSLYIIENSRLHRVNPANGKFERLGDATWKAEPIAMTSHNNSLYVIENSTLHRVNPENGTFKRVGGANWNAAPIAMVTHRDTLLVIENKNLFRVNVGTGEFESLSEEWRKAPVLMTRLGDSLYIIEATNLWRANPTNGDFVQLVPARRPEDRTVGFPQTASGSKSEGSTTAYGTAKISKRPDGTGFIEFTVTVKKSGVNGTGYAAGVVALTTDDGNTLWKSEVVKKQKGADAIRGVSRGSTTENFEVPADIMQHVTRMVLLVGPTNGEGLPRDVKEATAMLKEIEDFIKAARGVAEEAGKLVAVIVALAA